MRTEAGGRVERLSLGNNNLTGPIPPELGNLTSLIYLWLYGNDLTGPIPPELGNLTSLTEMWLSGNDLTGPIPPELGNLTSLMDLWLYGNDLSGSVPPELGNLTSLTDLRLSGNDLTGPIPPELGNLTSLMDLWLYGNDLSGSVPPELGNLTSLTWLVLSSNDLTGPIPPELGNLTSLTDLWLSGNDLTGPIPPELGNLTSLTDLWLSGNDLTGPIPPELGNLTSMGELSLARNNLTGALPPELAGISTLRGLDLTNNTGLSGPLPARLTDLRLEKLLTGGTDLCAPSDPSFQAWLETVYQQRVVACSSGGGGMAYLTQAVQSRDHPVPLVAGERALLRVFVTATHPTTAGIPQVRARFYLNGTERHVIDIPAKTTSIPTEVLEHNLSVSANAEIPGEVVQPGLEMVIEIDPDGTLDPGLGVAKRIPDTGRMVLDVRDMPVFDLTVIPFLWSADPNREVVETTEAMEVDPDGHELLWDTRTLLPIGDLKVTAHEPVLSSSNSKFVLLAETRAIRAMEGGTGHYMGMMSGTVNPGGGVAYRSSRVNFSEPYASVIAHELGHNLSLPHAPCGGAGGSDPSFPYTDGSVGVWGYDFRGGGRLVGPQQYYDLMSYCEPEWVSDYHFTNALRFRLFDEGPPQVGGLHRSRSRCPPPVGRDRCGRRALPPPRLRGRRPACAPRFRRRVPGHRTDLQRRRALRPRLCHARGG